MNLYSYVVRYDSGFAPNPFYGFCTLATCKPQIREKAEIGDWVIGTGSKSTNIVYAMKVTEILSLEEYWDDKRFQYKKPYLKGSRKRARGDNIYSKVEEKWKQMDSYHSNKNGSHNERHIKRDTRANKVLISDDYVYFGGSRQSIPNNLESYGKSIIHKGPNCKKFSTPKDERMIKDFKIWIRSLGETGFVAPPSDWGE